MSACTRIIKTLVKEKIPNPLAVGNSEESDTPAEYSREVCGADAPYIYRGASVCADCLKALAG